MIEAHFINGPRHDEHHILDHPTTEYLIPIHISPHWQTPDNTPTKPVHVYRHTHTHPNGLHTYLYQGTRHT